MSGPRLLDLWSPPDGSGDPVAVLATSFTFEADFFSQDCLSRFLRLSSVADSDLSEAGALAAMLEEEDRLAEAQVTVLVDSSSAAEKRNLRWDVLPVRAPGGLLHAKVAVLLWERAARLLIGSANLTAAGYRRNIETVVAFDLGPGAAIPREFVRTFVEELRSLVSLVPGSLTGARARAASTLDLLESRAEELSLPREQASGLRLQLAPARPGLSPFAELPAAWRGVKPLTATLLSPYWDGSGPSPALAEVRRHLTGRPVERRLVTVAAAFDPHSGVVSAPASVAEGPGTVVRSFDPKDEEPRSLHAKVAVLESDEWLAALIGSSNMTEPGLGLHPRFGHHEVNVWIGCPASSETANVLRGLVPTGDELVEETYAWDPPPDEDAAVLPPPPDGFLSCVVHAGADPAAVIELATERLPEVWEVREPGGGVLLDADLHQTLGSPTEARVDLADGVLPPYLDVHWVEGGAWLRATLAANVDDRAALPPPKELAELPVSVLLAALASSRPLPAALEHELRRHRGDDDLGGRPKLELDALKRFDSSGLLFQRTRHVSQALWRIEQRLARPLSSTEVLRWRLHGPIGPVAVAEGLLKAEDAGLALPGETHFLLAELALAIAHVDWAEVGGGLEPEALFREVHEVLDKLEAYRARLGPLEDPALRSYVDEAFAAAAP